MQDVNVYSLAAEGGAQLSAHFKVREFACKDGADPVFVSPRLVQVLEAIRQHFGAPVTVTSGYRTPAHNAREGGAAKSQHLYGAAADIKVKGVSPAAVADYAEQLLGDHGGVGRYGTFTHIDVRADKARWRG